MRPLALALLLGACAHTARPAPAAPVAAPEAAPALEPLVGVWREEFHGRSGCGDTVTVRASRGALVITGVDCNDGDAYVFGVAAYDGRRLTVTLLVRETGVTVRYALDWRPDGSLGGTATVRDNTYAVHWRREP